MNTHCGLTVCVSAGWTLTFIVVHVPAMLCDQYCESGKQALHEAGWTCHWAHVAWNPWPRTGTQAGWLVHSSLHQGPWVCLKVKSDGKRE